MSVFICWSEDRSHELARAVRVLLVGSLRQLRKKDVFISDSIEKGANWFNSIESELEKARVGIVCLTAENLASPWLHFEAGALGRRLSLLSKPARQKQRASVKQGQPRRLFTLLHGITGSELKGPLSAYQSTTSTEKDMGEMVLSIARVLKLRDVGKIARRASIIPKGPWKQFQETIEGLSVPARKVITDFDLLFQRKTFNEPIHHCADQAWLRRYDGVSRTREQLLLYEDRVQAACSPHERAVFKMLLAELDGYGMAMQSLLLKLRRFPLSDVGELEVEHGIRTCCEDRRLAIKSLATLLLHPLDEPLREEAVRFMGAETNEERKMIVHRLEGEIRRQREADFERLPRGSFRAKALDDALVALAGGKTPLEFRASSWDLDRIYYYLLIQYFTTAVLRWKPDRTRAGRRVAGLADASHRAMEHDWLCAARDVEMEVERYRAKSKGGSLMPLTYALCALQELHPERARSLENVQSAVASALDLVDKELGKTLESTAGRTIRQLLETIRAAVDRSARRRSGDGQGSLPKARPPGPALSSAAARAARPPRPRRIRRTHTSGH
jgi:hypothetical protein